MRYLFLLLATFALTACQTTVNAPGPATAELQPIIDEVVANANADVGEEAGSDLIVVGASSQGNTVVIDFRARRDFAELLREYPRAEVRNFLNQYIRNDFCSDPEIFYFVEAGGRAELRIADNVGRNLTTLTLDRC